MIKTVIKEAIIVILILIAITFILGILFYESIPNNKTVPVKIQSYNLPQDVEEELKESISGAENIVETLRVDDSDLDQYEATNDYNKGKADPFRDYTKQEENTGNNIGTGNNSNIQNNVNNNTNTIANNTNNNNSEVYFNTSGKQ